MTFTWWTYWVALKRARKAEVFEWHQHVSAFRGPHAWLRRKEFTDTLYKRKLRERGSW